MEQQTQLDDPTKARGSDSGMGGMNILSLGGNTDFRRWSWTGYFALGKGSEQKEVAADVSGAPHPTAAEAAPAHTSQGSEDEQNVPTTNTEKSHIEVDQESLSEAISSLGVHIGGDETQTHLAVSEPTDAEVQNQEKGLTTSDDAGSAAVHTLSTGASPAVHQTLTSANPPSTNISPIPSGVSSRSATPRTSSPALEIAQDVSRSPSPGIDHDHIPVPSFSNLSVYLAPPDDPLATVRRKVLYLIVRKSPLSIRRDN